MNRFMEYVKYLVVLTIWIALPSYFYTEDGEYAQLSDEPVVLNELTPAILSEHEDRYVRIEGYCIGNRPIGFEKNSLATRYYAIKECNSDLGDKQVFVISEVKDRNLNFLEDERDDFFTGRLVKGMHVKQSLKSDVQKSFNVKELQCWMLYEGQSPSVVKREGTIIILSGLAISSAMLVLFIMTDLKKKRRRDNASAVFVIKNVLQDPDPEYVQLQVEVQDGRIARGDRVPITMKREIEVLDVKLDADGLTRIKLKKNALKRWKTLIKRVIYIEQVI